MRMSDFTFRVIYVSILGFILIMGIVGIASTEPIVGVG